MKKVFEDFFSELQADMVSICLEYAEKNAEVIYIYCSAESNMIACQFFFKINGTVVKKNKLNDTVTNGFRYDVSLGRQKAVMKILTEDVGKIVALCNEYGRDKPTEIKLIYNVKKNSLEAKYKYDLIYSNDPNRTDYDVFNEWFDEIANLK